MASKIVLNLKLFLKNLKILLKVLSGGSARGGTLSLFSEIKHPLNFQITSKV